MWPLKLGCIALALGSAGAVWAAGPAAAQGGNMYCCQDSGGRRTCGDVLPEQCRGRAFKVLDRDGNVLREVGPPQSAEQKALVAAEAQRKKEQEDALRQQRRKDMALLDTYGSLQDVERARSRSETDIQEAMKQTEAKIAALQKQRKKLENEADFYRNKPLPAEVAKGLRDNDSEVKSLSGLLDAKKAEMAKVRARYDEDQRRYLELTGGRQAASR